MYDMANVFRVFLTIPVSALFSSFDVSSGRAFGRAVLLHVLDWGHITGGWASSGWGLDRDREGEEREQIAIGSGRE